MRTVTDTDFTWNSVLVDGKWIHYRVAGPVDAPPMIHVHGFGISGSYLMPTAELLTDSFRVYVPDLPGFGRSPKPVEQLSIEELGMSVNHFMDALGVEQAILVGNSLGCAIIAELIEKAPEKVSKAVMVGLAGGPHNQPLGKAVVQMARDGLHEPPSLLTVAGPDYLRFGLIRALKLFNWMTKFPAFERFISMPVPVLAVIGSEDPLRPPWSRISAIMAQLPPGLTIVLFQGAAHAINFTHPRELAHTIRQYVADQPIRMDANNPTGVPVLQLQRPV
jgi:pimeloyl-ACP methyl ester carboxylesterase